MKRLDVWMILAVAEDPRDHLALLGDAQPLVGAQRLDIDRPRHAAKVSTANAMVKGVSSSLRA